VSRSGSVCRFPVYYPREWGWGRLYEACRYFGFIAGFFSRAPGWPGARASRSDLGQFRRAGAHWTVADCRFFFHIFRRRWARRVLVVGTGRMETTTVVYIFSCAPLTSSLLIGMRSRRAKHIVPLAPQYNWPDNETFPAPARLNRHPPHLQPAAAPKKIHISHSPDDRRYFLARITS